MDVEIAKNVTVVVVGIRLAPHQEKVIDKLKSGSILRGGVGSGKSRISLTYYFIKECGGSIDINGAGEYLPMKKPKDLYIITTARKRDLHEWDGECTPFLLSSVPGVGTDDVKVIVDSWQNISKYINVENAFFIFDEQRIVGSGVWVKSFLKIAKKNNWILLSATPGDTWMDYVPVFIANGFYRNRTEFIKRHVVYSRFSKFPKIDHYIECGRLEKIKQMIVVDMDYVSPSRVFHKPVNVPYDKETFDKVFKKRWNVFENEPIKNISELCYLMRRVVNSDVSRLEFIKNLIETHPKIIVFYNFDYELEMLRKLCIEMQIEMGEWNGHKHEAIPDEDSWVYLVQYTAGAEGWNCIETNCIVFYSQNYSYKIMVQAAGRIDRFNTSYLNLYYYHIRSNSPIDLAIKKSLDQKKTFNERCFFNVA